MARILEGHGAEAEVVPTLETRVHVDRKWRLRQAEDAARGGYGAAVFLTGIGSRLLFEAAEEAGVDDELRSALDDTLVVARGPKARSGLRSAGVEVDVEPGEATGRAILEALADHGDRLRDGTVLVQRHGRRDDLLEDGLQDLGVELRTLELYRYAPPDDLPAVRSMLDGCGNGALDAVVFTSPPAVRGLKRAARKTGHLDDLRRVARDGDVTIAAVGGSTATELESGGVPAHVIPDDYTQPALARALARHWQDQRRPASSHDTGGSA